MIALLRSEWTKLRTTRVLPWSSLLVVAVTVGYAVLLGHWKSGGQDGQPVYVDNWMALGGIVGGQGLPGIGLMVFMIIGALSVAGEYRTGLIQLTYAAAPRRVRVLVAKAGVTALTSAVLALGLTVLSEYSLKWSTTVDSSRLGFGADLRPLYVVPLMVFLAVVLAVGLGAIIRSAAGVVAVILVWVTGIENLTLFAGDDTGSAIRKLLPFSNEQNVVTNGVGALAWSSPWTSVLIFAAWTIALGVVGATVIRLRDV